MGKKATKTPYKAPLILSGDATKDFKLWLDSDREDYKFGVSLIENYTKNYQLVRFFKSKNKSLSSLEMLDRNINVIYLKCIKK